MATTFYRKRLLPLVVIAACFSLLSGAGCKLCKNTISVDTKILDFGEQETEKTFILKVTGNLNWSIQTDDAWIDFYPREGTATQTIQVTVYKTSLRAGQYEGALTIHTDQDAEALVIAVKTIVTYNCEALCFDENTACLALCAEADYICRDNCVFSYSNCMMECSLDNPPATTTTASSY
jgi:hypothetical protein